ncbi:MAG TPA: CDP-diacylglycerol--serine O-phosphatidyltransferase [Firmicutes bacterium]|nr:CDP-diacylglycerol--serine O-phosphatidyltransferase [Bacillota bacterium]
MKKKTAANIRLRNNLPNIITGINLILGYYALALTLKGEFKLASSIILIAMVMDGVDGKIAKLLSLEGDFGKELDSLADLISFGVAPALLLYRVFLINYAVWGFAASALLPLAGAIRLARFNLLSARKGFTGLPITIAGGAAACLVDVTFITGIAVLFAVIILSLLMLSAVPYPKLFPSFKNKKKGFLFIIAVSALLIASIWTQDNVFMLFLLAPYIAGGLIKCLPGVLHLKTKNSEHKLP